jgi:hypothetical protein
MKSNTPEIAFGGHLQPYFLIMPFPKRPHTQKLQVEASILNFWQK